MFQQSAKILLHLRARRHIRTALTDNIAASIAVALIQSRLDYSNSVCYGISAGNLAKLQRVRNFAAFIVAHHQSKGPANSHLSNLQLASHYAYASDKLQNSYLLTYKSLATGYLHTLLNAYQPYRYLRSQ